VIAEEELTNVRVDNFNELLVEYVTRVGGRHKGRSLNDFEAEFQQGLMNQC
jgi:phosphopantetheine adenylyltransferase